MSLLKVTSPHMHTSGDTGALMRLVIYATFPGLLASTYFFGWGVLINVIWACLLAVFLEALIMLVRKRSVRYYLTDCSALVTATLLGLALPHLAPWWLTLIGIGFAIIIGKQLYGGMGFNPFNPAMLGYVVLLISFPQEMTSWASASGARDVSMTFSEAFFSIFSGSPTPDAFTGATPLDEYKTRLVGSWSESQIFNQPLYDSSLGFTAGTGWLWVNIAYLLGGCYLLYKKAFTWHIPASYLLLLFVSAFIMFLFGSTASPLLHLFSGATMLGAFFIATDPVSASTTPKGKLIYGGLIGLLIIIIRVKGNYPDAVAFAVLLANICAPLIDHYTQPRTYGHRKPSRYVASKD